MSKCKKPPTKTSKWKQFFFAANKLIWGFAELFIILYIVTNNPKLLWKCHLKVGKCL